MSIIIYRSKANPSVNTVTICNDKDLIETLNNIRPMISELVDIFINATRL